MAQPSPIQSWNRTFPCVVSAAKSGAESWMRSDMENSSLKVLVEGRNPEHHARWTRFIMSKLSDLPRYVSYRGAVSQSLPALTNNPDEHSEISARRIKWRAAAR